MDVAESLVQPAKQPITCIDMHTTGEPTRIVVGGYPELAGGTTLLEQRVEARSKHDNIRRRLMLEPRGHYDMYGAILRRDTELTRSGEAHIGVLFTTNDGYSTMCGHATIALGRFLVDTHDERVFPNRKKVVVVVHATDGGSGGSGGGGAIAVVKLHAPCGLILVNVPTTPDGSRSDPGRPVSFVSVPSFATGISVTIPIPPASRWPELGPRETVTADFAYGGAFYCFVSCAELGFPKGLKEIDLHAAGRATKSLKAVINGNPSLRHLFSHPDHEDLGFLYSMLLVDRELRPAQSDASWSLANETGLCYFADGQLDRSPTGSAVAARVALAHAKGELAPGQERTYHSLVSASSGWRGGFSARLEEVDPAVQGKFPATRVRIEGFAYYTGVHRFVVEEGDLLGERGFVFGRGEIL